MPVIVKSTFSLRVEEKAKQENSTSRSTLSFPRVSAGFLFRLLFDPEDGDDIFLRNIGFSPNYTALQPRGPQIFVLSISLLEDWCTQFVDSWLNTLIAFY
jgi:hypothetical protein